MSNTSGTPHKLASADERGYGAAHRRARAEAIAAWQDGDPCARCGGPMRHGEPVHLDHTDDRTGYLGLSHAACNVSSTGRMHRAKRDAVCDHCGITYQTRWESQKYCSNDCRRADIEAAKIRRLAEQPPADRSPLAKQCKGCGSTFSTQYSTQTWCSDQCRDRHKKLRRRHRRRAEGRCPTCGQHR